ncbi:hypothetical protein BMETH_179_2 [methanotrophic bacterial endosymbiont of Bathymodiolus sp.]|nr:hypothetical protein BMETH_179_2 [methanotrophic bacterial endosymbiont of Bathymodiolus sp.]
MRIAVRYAGVYAIFMILGLSLLFWTSSRYVDEQISTGLQQRMFELVRIDREQGREKLINTLNAHQLGYVNHQRHFFTIEF